MPRAHIEIAKGNFESNFQYCTKEGDWTQDGEEPLHEDNARKKGGGANAHRWEDARKRAREGDFDSIPADIQLRVDKALFREYSRHKPDPPSNHHTSKNFWIYGPSGTGKSYSARMVGQHLGWRTYVKEPESKWWDGYEGQELVIIDDFDKYQLKQGGAMKRWLDIYPFQAETKGGQQLVRPKVVIVTSNYAPSDIWNDEQTLVPIERRVRIMQTTLGTFAMTPADFAAQLVSIIKSDHSLCTQEEELAKKGESHGDVALEDTV